jgi:hypothetical protein
MTSGFVRRWLPAACWLVIIALCVLRFCFLTADFPNHSPWSSDQARFTDEGWWASGAITHHLLGRWTLPGDYNPVVALPVWPALLAVLFHFTGVSMVATRAFTVALSIATLGIVYVLVRRYAVMRPQTTATLCVLFLAASPFAYVYSRIATLETFIVFEFCLLLLLASLTASSRIALWAALPVVVTAIVLTKTTAIVLLPAVLWMVWRTLGGKFGGLWRACVAGGVIPALLFKLYVLFIFHRGYGPDYIYFFSENGQPDFAWSQTFTAIASIFRSCLWIDRILYPMALAALIVSIVWLRKLWGNPLFSASWIALGGQCAFLFLRQGDIVPRYVFVMLAPMVVVVGLCVESLPQRIVRNGAILLLGVAVGMNVVMIAALVRTRTQAFFDAAQSMRKIVESDQEHNRLVLGVSAAQISLMTGIPSINDPFGTQSLAAKIARFQPGWYQAWVGIGPDERSALSAYRIEEVARYNVFDDPDRSGLILYRLTARDAASQEK